MTPIVTAPQPCKPRINSTHTDRLPVPMREDTEIFKTLPSIVNGWRIWPDGRKERVNP